MAQQQLVRIVKLEIYIFIFIVYFKTYSNKGHDGFLGNSVVGEWWYDFADSNTRLT